ncbi:STAS domain-containing protein [Haliea sp. E17]|uniref:STAS domain-containing protein n=1 Tax=Haliea sp. E17 TaxID=3401576 RepID=UPI003AAD3618
MQDGRFLAASHNGAYVIRLEGDVRLTLCNTIDDYFQAMFDDPDFASVWVDLEAAEGLDSTTLGLLAKLAITARDRFGFQPAIFSHDAGINRLLRSMGFLSLFELHEEPCDSPENLSEIPRVRGSEEAVRDKIIEAHRVLMDLSEANRSRFRDLMVALEQG